jgi:hypothetical protein
MEFIETDANMRNVFWLYWAVSYLVLLVSYLVIQNDTWWKYLYAQIVSVEVCWLRIILRVSQSVSYSVDWLATVNKLNNI